MIGARSGARWASVEPVRSDIGGRGEDAFAPFTPFVLEQESGRGEIVLGWAQLDGLIARGRAGEIPFPIRFRRHGGGQLGDLLWSGGLEPVLVSDRFVDVLRDEGLAGWRLYPIELVDARGHRVEGYHGLVVDDAASGMSPGPGIGELVVSAALDRALRAAGVTAMTRRMHAEEEPRQPTAPMLDLDGLDRWDLLDAAVPAAVVTGDSADWVLRIEADPDAATWSPWWPDAPGEVQDFWTVAYGLSTGDAVHARGVHLRRSGGSGRLHSVMTSPDPSLLPLCIVSTPFLDVLRAAGFTGWSSSAIDLIDGEERIIGYHLLWTLPDPDGVHDVAGMERVNPEPHQDPSHARWMVPAPRFRLVELAPAVLKALVAAGISDFLVHPSWSRAAQHELLREAAAHHDGARYWML